MDFEFLVSDGRFLFENGATSNREKHQGPPEDEFARLRLLREFLQHKLEKEEVAFHAYKVATMEAASLHSRYPNLPTPDATAPVLLRRGQQRVLRLRNRLKEIDDKLADSPEAHEQQKRNEQRMEHNQEQTALLTKIEAIRI